jgi:hypothetical protein
MTARRSSSISLAAMAALSALAAAAAGKPPADLLGLVPAGAIAVAQVRVRELRASTPYRECEERFAFGPGRSGFADVVRVTGIDPERDIDDLVVAILGDGTENPHGATGAIGFLAGRFDAAAIRTALAEHGAMATAAAPLVFEFPEHRPAGRRSLLALARPDLLVFGDAHAVEDVLGSVSTRQRAPDATLLRALSLARAASEVRGAVAISSFVPHLRRQPRPFASNPDPAAVLSSLSWVTFDADFSGGEMRLAMRAVAASADDADRVHQAVDGLVAFGKLAAKDDEELLALLAETTVEQSGNEVVLATRGRPCR